MTAPISSYAYFQVSNHLQECQATCTTQGDTRSSFTATATCHTMVEILSQCNTKPLPRLIITKHTVAQYHNISPEHAKKILDCFIKSTSEEASKKCANLLPEHKSFLFMGR